MSAVGRCLPLTHGIAAAREVAAGASLGDVSGLVWTEAAIGVAYAVAGLRTLPHPRARIAAQRRARRLLGSIAGVIPPVIRHNRNFRNYFIGQAISLLGDQITLIALPLTAVLALHATAAQMGTLTTIALVPNLIFSLHAGSWVDRRGGRTQVMLAADIGRGLLIADHPDRICARAPDVGAAVRRGVRLPACCRSSSTSPTAASSRRSSTRGLRRRELADARQPCVLVPGGDEHRWRSSSSSCAAPTRSRSTRCRFSGRRCSSGGSMRSTPRPARRARAAHGRGTLDPPQRDHPRRVAGRRDAQLLQLHLSSRCSCSTRPGSCTCSRLRSASSSAPPRSGRSRLRDHGARFETLRRRPGLPRRLLPLPGAADPGAARRRATLARPPLSLHSRVLLRHRPDAARHPRGHDQRRSIPRPLRSRVSGAFMVVNNGVRPIGTARRRRARHRDRPAADAVDRNGRRALRHVVPVAVADPLAARVSRRRRRNDEPARSSSTSGSTATRWRSRPRHADGRPSVRMVLLKCADERRLHLLHELRPRGRAASSPRTRTRRCSSTGPDLRCGSKGASSGSPRRSPTPTGRRGPPPPAGARPRRSSRSRSAPAPSSRRRSRRSPRSRRGPERWGGFRLVPDALRVLAPPRRPAARKAPFRARADGWEWLLLQP